MTTAQAIVLIGGAVATLLINFAIILTAFKRWLTKIVSEPIEGLEDDIRNVRKAVRVAANKATRAHNRIDRHLEVHKNG